MGTLEEWLTGYLPFYIMMPLWSVPYLMYNQGTMLRDILFSPPLELPRILLRPWNIMYQFRSSLSLYMSLNNDVLDTFITFVLPFSMLAIQKGVAENFDILQFFSYFILELGLSVVPQGLYLVFN
jgi:hypothetical protein